MIYYDGLQNLVATEQQAALGIWHCACAIPEYWLATFA